MVWQRIRKGWRLRLALAGTPPLQSQWRVTALSTPRVAPAVPQWIRVRPYHDWGDPENQATGGKPVEGEAEIKQEL